MPNLWRNAGAYIALVVVILIFAIRQPEFRQPSNLLNVLDQSVEIAVVAVGMTAIILTGGIDLSVGSVAALAPFLGAWVMTTHPHALGGFAGTALCGLLVALGVGVLVGAVNGLSITKTFLPPFIATLGMMSIVRGLVFVRSHGTGISSGLPPGYTATAYNLLSVRTASGATANLTLAVLVMLAVFVVGHLILSRTKVGRAIYAIGGNETAARLSGLRVDRIKLGVYIVGGLLAALGGLIETATVGAAVPDAGLDLELNAIAAVVIGGTSLTGGRGNLAGTFAGALLMRVIRNGLNLEGTDSNWQKVAIGAIIMVAVAFDEIQKRRTGRS
jgi:ribose/xylose/arabinose/galactoside ABC-type transport system permease subunit